MDMDELHRKTSVRHKAIILTALAAGAMVNLLTDDTRITTIVWSAVAGAFASIYSGMYMARSAWWLTPAGRAQLWVKLSFSILMIWITLGLAFGPWPGREEVRDWLFLGFAVASGNVALTLWGVQRRERIYRAGLRRTGL